MAEELQFALPGTGVGDTPGIEESVIEEDVNDAAVGIEVVATGDGVGTLVSVGSTVASGGAVATDGAAVSAMEGAAVSANEGSGVPGDGAPEGGTVPPEGGAVAP